MLRGALIFTEVVRATLFFYLTPILSTVLARIVLGEPITVPRWATIGLGLLGLLIIVRADTGMSGDLSAGDWMGIAGGLIWAAAAVVMKSDDDGNVIDFTLSYFAWGVSRRSLLIVPLMALGQFRIGKRCEAFCLMVPGTPFGHSSRIRDTWGDRS